MSTNSINVYGRTVSVIGTDVEKLTPPVIVLTGTRVTQADATRETYTEAAAVVSVAADITESVTTGTGGDSVTFSKQNPVVFAGGSFTVQFTSVYSQAAEMSTPAGATNVEFGRNPAADNVAISQTDALAGKAEIRYSVNGKDPARTASYSVYDGQVITISANKSGEDNTIIKARVYYDGKQSDVTTVQVNLVDQSIVTLTDPS